MKDITVAELIIELQKEPNQNRIVMVGSYEVYPTVSIEQFVCNPTDKTHAGKPCLAIKAAV